MKSPVTLVLALVVAIVAIAAAAPACEMAGPNTHVGIITAIDTAKSTLTLRDAQTNKDLTFLARAEMLKGVAVKDEVAIIYAQDGGTLRATAIRKVGG